MMGNIQDKAKCLDTIGALLNDAACAETVTERLAVLATARETAYQCLSIDPNKAELNYATGLVLYHSFTENEASRAEVERYLSRACEIDPDHQFAKLYLGHLYYDVGEYHKALPYLEGIREEYFISLKQPWRILKVHELILCCKVYLSDLDLSMGSFSSVIQEYLISDPEDVPVPIELLATVKDSAGSLVWSKVDKTQVWELVVAMFTKLGYESTLKELIRENSDPTSHNSAGQKCE